MPDSDHVNPTAVITRRSAQALLAAAREAGGRLGFAPATAVTDPGGHLIAFERGDSTPFLAGDIAVAKAWTAASWQVSSSYWNRYVQDRSVAPLENVAGVLPVGGGYAVVHDGRVVGAIGVSGGSLDQDEQTALAALDALGLTTTTDPDA
jgi:uncharacterized protein GlcG (DUF336 family)